MAIIFTNTSASVFQSSTPASGKKKSSPKVTPSGDGKSAEAQLAEAKNLLEQALLVAKQASLAQQAQQGSSKKVNRPAIRKVRQNA